MKRKIIKQGHDTLTITLPKAWARKYGISPGDEVDIIEQEKNLVVKTDKGPSLTSIETDISGLTPPVIWRYMISAYRAGYNEIKVIGIGKSKDNIHSAFSYTANMDHLLNNKSSMISPTEVVLFATSSTLRKHVNWDVMSPMEVVSACVNRMVGMEIVDQKNDYCVIKELGETTYKEFDNALRRIFLLLKLESNYVLSALKGEKENIKSIHIIDTNLDRFEDYCLRVLNIKGYSDVRKTPSMFALIFVLEMLGDELRKSGQHIIDSKNKFSKPIIDLFSIQTVQINRFYELFYKFDKKKMLEIYEEDKKATHIAEKNYKKLSNEEKELLHHLKKIGIFILNLTELKIDMEA